MTPRLKLMLDGRVVVLSAAKSPIRVSRAEALVKIHYGDRMAFAMRWRLSYSAVTAALRDDTVMWQTAGRVAEVRQLLGLRSEPSARSRRLAAVHELRRSLRSPDWTFATESTRSGGPEV